VEQLRRQRRDGGRMEWLGEESRSFLRDLFLGKTPTARVREQDSASSDPGPGPEAVAEAATVERPPQATVVRRVAGKEPVKAAPRGPIPEVAVPRGGSKDDRIEALRAQFENCEICSSIDTLREQLVFSCGNPDAELMFVGDAPGLEEEKQGEPFVGAAGQLLTRIIETMGLRRDQVYLSNLVKYRPSIEGGAGQGESNRNPTPREMEACLPYLQAEIAVVEPRVLVALGPNVIQGLLRLPGSVGKAREQWHQHRNVPARATYHPSYLLDNKTLTERRKLWLDMLEVMARLEMPISDKQRTFFKQS